MALGVNQSTTSMASRMKLTFLLLCIVLCFILYILYSSSSLNWTLIPSFFSKSLVVSLIQSANKTSNETKNLVPRASRRFAFFACSIHSPVQAYSFYTPITAASWNRVGYEVIIAFVGDFTLPNVLTARLNLSRSYLRHVGGHIIDIQCNASYAVKISQVARVFSGFLPDSIVHDDDDVLTGDSDLMPLKASEYRPTNGTDGFIFNAFCCGSFKRREKSYRMFPMGHIYLKKKDWRAIVMESKQRTELLVNADQRTQDLLSSSAPLSFDLISIYFRHEFKTVYDSNMVKGDSAWYMDQVLCSMMLTDYREKHKDYKLHERGRAERLDRANSINYWDRDKFDQFGDAHLIHDSILQENNWKIFNKLLKALFNATLVNQFNDYHRQFMIADKIPAKTKR